MDIIIHLAATDAVESEANPAGALEMNGVATVSLIEAAISQHVSKFVYLSTSHVYGSVLSGIVTEEACPVPIHPYATSHEAAEDVVAAAVKQNRIQGVIIRLSNSFGAPVLPEANCWDLLIPGLSRQAITMGRMLLKYSGLQKRDFISITDATRAIVHLTFYDQLTAPESIVFNVGGNCVCTVFEMLERIRYRCKQLLVRK